MFDFLDYLTRIGGKQLTLLGIQFGLDKLFHIGSIIFLGFLFFIILSKINITKNNKLLKHSLIIILLIIISYGKELFDLYIRKTVFSENDIYADIIGIIIFYIFFGIILIIKYGINKYYKSKR